MRGIAEDNRMRPISIGSKGILLTAAGGRQRFMGIVHHTDAQDEGKAKGWTVVDMRRDWKVIFPFENR